MTKLPELIQSRFARHREVQRAALDLLAEPLVAAAQAMIAAYRRGGKAIFCGNGGSAADAQHLAAELLGRYRRERRALPALALHADGSSLTAIANDHGYDQVFARQLEGLGRAEDVVVGITTSGNSPNVVAALRYARQAGWVTIALTGRGGGAAAASADHLLAVPSDETPRIQECHILLGHILCEAVEEALFGEETFA